MIIKIAARNLWRNKLRTLLAIAAMSVATGLLILILATNDGLLWSMIRSSTEFYHGHIRFMNAAYEKERDIHYTLETKIAPEISNHPELLGVAPRLKGMFLISSDSGDAAVSGRTQAVEIMGIDILAEKPVSAFHKSVISGSYFENENTDGEAILVGQELARKLRVEVGSRLILMGQGAYGSSAAGIFRVKGIFNTGDKMRDSRMGLLPLSVLGALMDFSGQCHEWVASVRDPVAVNMVSDDLRSRLKDLSIKSWRDLLPQISQSLDLWIWVQLIVLFIFYFAVVLVTSNIMSMAILERAKEFAVLRALGFARRRIFAFLCMEGFFLSLISALIGGVCGYLAAFYLRFYPLDLSFFLHDINLSGTSLKPQITALARPFNVGLPVVTMLILGPLTVIFPALRLLRKPVSQLLGER